MNYALWLDEPSVADSLAEGLLLIDSTGSILTSNRSARRLLGVDEIYGINLADAPWCLVGEDGSPFPVGIEPVQLSLATGVPQNDVVLGIDKHSGPLTWLSVNIQPLVSPGSKQPYAVVLSFVDITEARRKELLLRRNEERWRQLFDHSLDGVIIKEQGGRILEVNRTACEILGRSRDEIIAIGRALLVDMSDPRTFAALDRRPAPGTFRGELTFLRADGTKFPAEVSSTLFIDPSGTPLRSLVFRDISERKRNDKLRDEFISTVSHELRTPLTSILGGLRLLERGIAGNLPEFAGEILRIAQLDGERLSSLISDLLDVAHLGSDRIKLTFTSLNLCQVFETACKTMEPLAKEKGIEIVCRIEGGPVRADSQRLIQVLVNLLSNAIKFSPAGSRVDMEASDAGSNVVRITVTDRGLGIPLEDRSRIFEPFQQVDATDSRHKGGTGLGLAICKGIVALHGGEMGIDSEFGKGSSFWIELPRA